MGEPPFIRFVNLCAAPLAGAAQFVFRAPGVHLASEPLYFPIVTVGAASRKGAAPRV